MSDRTGAACAALDTSSLSVPECSYGGGFSCAAQTSIHPSWLGCPTSPRCGVLQPARAVTLIAHCRCCGPAYPNPQDGRRPAAQAAALRPSPAGLPA